MTASESLSFRGQSRPGFEYPWPDERPSVSDKGFRETKIDLQRDQPSFRTKRRPAFQLPPYLQDLAGIRFDSALESSRLETEVLEVPVGYGLY